jgi:two-component system chemotaxis sensor kinase CheA
VRPPLRPHATFTHNFARGQVAVSEKSEVLNEFLLECEENLDSFDKDLLALEQDPSRSELVDSSFRAIHSIKGAAGFMEIPTLVNLSHAAETLLGAIRDGKVPPDGDRVSALLESEDLLRGMLDAVRAGEIPEAAPRGIIQQLKGLGIPDGGPDPANDPLASAGPMGFVDFDDLPDELFEQPTAEAAGAMVAAEKSARAPAARGPAKKIIGKAAEDSSSRRSDAALSSVRVDVEVLNDLMNLAGELVVCRNQILRVVDSEASTNLKRSVRQLDHLASSVQERVMKTRMRPVAEAWSGLPRVVRDLSKSCEKPCSLEMEGGDVELDRSILERIKDPLSHIIRNSIDHGLEAPEDREALGKPRAGQLLLRAGHVASQVHIEFSDDGKGLNIDRIREKAIQRGLVSSEAATRMSDKEIQNLIFEPGFSTNDNVTKLSGRGVGMDVVRSNLEQIGGTADIRSKPGQGTTVRLKIPLTLAILPALIVRCGDWRLAVAQTNLVELLDIGGKRADDLVEYLGDAPIVRRHGRILPLVFLGRTLGREQTIDSAEYIVVVQADSLSYGLVVDEVHDTEEIVVKPMGRELSNIPVFSGATVLGDGGIALILDVPNLARFSNVYSQVQNRRAVEATSAAAGEAARRLLRFEVEGIGKGALPLDKVIRIEEVRASRLQRQQSRCFMQYEGKVVQVTDLVERTREGEELVSLVLCRVGERRKVFAVTQVLDVVETTEVPDPELGPDWSCGMAVIEGEITALLDPAQAA